MCARFIMPELPDVVLYIEALQSRVVGQPLRHVSLRSPFVLRSVTPPLEALEGQIVHGVHRVGKRIVLTFAQELSLVIHLMIAGRLRWRPTEGLPAADEPHRRPARPASRQRAAPPPVKLVLAVFAFDAGLLFFTEAGSKKRASLQVVHGADALSALNPGGIEPLTAELDVFRATLTKERHTIKRALTDPKLIGGIGNTYSDEILHAARMSPLKMSDALTDADWVRLHRAVQGTLFGWIARLRDEAGGAFPEKVTAFRDGMAVHGRFKQPCPTCGSPVQRIVYADNECNYCATCQTGGRLLADRALSRLLKRDWPKALGTDP